MSREGGERVRHDGYRGGSERGDSAAACVEMVTSSPPAAPQSGAGRAQLGTGSLDCPSCGPAVTLEKAARGSRGTGRRSGRAALQP